MDEVLAKPQPPRSGRRRHRVREQQSRKGVRQVKPWPLIPHPGDCSGMDVFPAGFIFEVYDGHLTQVYQVPSENVVPTHGAIRYVEHYNSCGPYTRYRFQICHNYLCGRCTKGVSCTYVHVNSLPPSTMIHVYGVRDYEMMPPGVTLFVHCPHSSAAPQMIPSQQLIRTEGAASMIQAVMSGTPSSVQRPQHCAHYQYKKVCNRGYSCNFIHSLIPAPH